MCNIPTTTAGVVVRDSNGDIEVVCNGDDNELRPLTSEIASGTAVVLWSRGLLQTGVVFVAIAAGGVCSIRVV